MSTVRPALILALLALTLSTMAIAAEPAPLGAELYSKYCASCHRQLRSTAIPDRSAKRIRSAISVFPSMSSLQTLTDSDLVAISAALSTNLPPVAAR